MPAFPLAPFAISLMTSPTGLTGQSYPVVRATCKKGFGGRFSFLIDQARKRNGPLLSGAVSTWPCHLLRIVRIAVTSLLRLRRPSSFGAGATGTGAGASYVPPEAHPDSSVRSAGWVAGRRNANSAPDDQHDRDQRKMGRPQPEPSPIARPRFAVRIAVAKIAN